MTNLNVAEWIETSRELIFQKFSRKIEKVMFTLPDRSESDLYIKAEGVTVCTLALTSDQNVILVKQFRPGPKKIFSELPGGYVKSGEEAIDIAKKELLEETGYVGDFQFVTTCFDDAYSTMVRHCFIATNCKKIEEIDNTLSDDDNENKGYSEIKEVILMPLSEFRELLQSGQMTDIEVGYLCLDFLKLL
jgi:ADP-ribose pyrophosphatase